MTCDECTQTSRNLYQDAGTEFTIVKERLQQTIQLVEDLEKKLEEKGAPYTPGRGLIEQWDME